MLEPESLACAKHHPQQIKLVEKDAFGFTSSGANIVQAVVCLHVHKHGVPTRAHHAAAVHENPGASDEQNELNLPQSSSWKKGATQILGEFLTCGYCTIFVQAVKGRKMSQTHPD